jgi:protein-tyrosine phosphatase
VNGLTTTAPAPTGYLPGKPLTIAGTHNLREVGGLPTAGGRITRHGALFRSDALNKLTPGGRRALAGLGIRRVIDLRTDSELAAAPSATEGLRLHTRHVSLFGEADPAKNGLGPDTLEQIYLGLIRDAGQRLVQVIRMITAGPGPVLVHCTAGKDRTGLVVALALDAIGVERPAVIADYAVSQTNLSGEWFDSVVAGFSAHGIDAQDLAPNWLASPAPLMADLLDRLDLEHGGSAAYLRANGLVPAELTTLHGRLTKPDQTHTDLKSKD